MQRIILIPQQSLGNAHSSQVPNETSTVEAIRPSSNSLAAQGSSLVVVPVSHSTALTTRKKNVHHVSSDVSLHHGSGSLGNSTAPAEILQLMNAFTQSNNALFSRSYREVLQDHNNVVERLAAACAINNNDQMAFYDNLQKKLEA